MIRVINEDTTYFQKNQLVCDCNQEGAFFEAFYYKDKNKVIIQCSCGTIVATIETNGMTLKRDEYGGFEFVKPKPHSALNDERKHMVCYGFFYETECNHCQIESDCIDVSKVIVIVESFSIDKKEK